MGRTGPHGPAVQEVPIGLRYNFTTRAAEAGILVDVLSAETGHVSAD